MITRLLHSIVARPTIYRCCQTTIGAGPITHRIAAHVPAGPSWVLDIGAGTGYARRLFPSEARYFALDLDTAMLRSSRQPLPIQSEATRLPLIDACMDIVLCKQVSHHVPDDRLDGLFAEIARVLRPTGTFLFMDAVRTDRSVSKLLWRYDRGAHPRLESDLVSHFEGYFRVVHREAHWHLHHYLLYVLAPRSVSADSARQAVKHARADSS